MTLKNLICIAAAISFSLACNTNQNPAPTPEPQPEPEPEPYVASEALNAAFTAFVDEVKANHLGIHQGDIFVLPTVTF